MMPKIGDVIDMRIKRLPHSTYIVGEVIGVREHYTQPDIIMVQVRGIDIWLDLDTNVDWEVIQ